MTNIYHIQVWCLYIAGNWVRQPSKHRYIHRHMLATVLDWTWLFTTDEGERED